MPITAASLLVKVQGDTSDAESKLKSVNEKVKDSHGWLKQLGSTALGTALGFAGFQGAGDVVGFVTGQLGDMVSAGQNANAVSAQTAAVLKSTHDASGMSAKSIGEYAEKLSGLTGINDDTIQSSENVLATFTGIGKKVFPDATKATADLATAMHMDMGQAALVVGKALNDPIQGVTALRREGVQLSAQQQKQVKDFMAVGDKASAQKIILGELNKEFGGSAEAAGKANGGMKIFGAQIDTAKQKIGQALIPIISDLMSKLAPLIINFANKIPDAIKTAEKFITSVHNKLSDLGSWINAHKSQIEDLGIVFAGVATAIVGSTIPALLASIPALVAQAAAWIADTAASAAAAIAELAAAWPVVLVGLAIGGLILAIKELIDHWSQVQAFFNNFKAKIGELLGDIGHLKDNVLNTLGSIPGKLFDLGKTFIQKMIDGIKSMAGNLAHAAGNVISGALHNIPVIGGLLPHFAAGGIMGNQGLAMVGENGPELVRLPPGSQVYSASQTAAMFSSGRGMPMTVHVHVHPQAINLDGYQIAQTTVQHLPDIIRSGTGVREF